MLASALSSKLAFSTVVASKTTKVTKKTAVITKVIIFFFCFVTSRRRRACSQSSIYTRKNQMIECRISRERRGGGSIDAIDPRRTDGMRTREKRR
jgi:hypothetical protein